MVNFVTTDQLSKFSNYDICKYFISVNNQIQELNNLLSNSNKFENFLIARKAGTNDALDFKERWLKRRIEFNRTLINGKIYYFNQVIDVLKDRIEVDHETARAIWKEYCSAVDGEKAVYRLYEILEIYNPDGEREYSNCKDAEDN